MAESRHIPQTEEGSGDDVRQRGDKLHPFHAEQAAPVGVIREQYPQKGGRHAG